MADYRLVNADQLDSDLGTIADAIREHTGSVERLPFPGGFVTAPAELVQLGIAQNEQEWAKKHYIATLRGTDTNDFLAHVPFKPDFVCIVPCEPYSCCTNYTYCGLTRDFRSFAKFIGYVQYKGTNEAVSYGSIYARSIDTFITWDGANVKFICPSNMKTHYWRKECLYLVIATNYAEGKTDKQLLEEYVLSLPDSGGSVILNTSRFNATGITDTQWAELIAQKPNWTFVIE